MNHEPARPVGKHVHQVLIFYSAFRNLRDQGARLVVRVQTWIGLIHGIVDRTAAPSARIVGTGAYGIPCSIAVPNPVCGARHAATRPANRSYRPSGRWSTYGPATPAAGGAPSRTASGRAATWRPTGCSSRCSAAALGFKG